MSCKSRMLASACGADPKVAQHMAGHPSRKSVTALHAPTCAQCPLLFVRHETGVATKTHGKNELLALDLHKTKEHKTKEHPLEWCATVSGRGSFSIGQRLMHCSRLIGGLRGGLLIEPLPLKPLLIEDLNCL